MLYVKDFDKKQFDVVYYEKYDHKDINPFSPMLKSFKIKGNNVVVTTTASGKLVCKGKTIQHFEVIDEAGKSYPAQAKILHDGSIRVFSNGVMKPKGVRYCFSNDAVPDLFDINGLPLAPFRTDCK